MSFLTWLVLVGFAAGTLLPPTMAKAAEPAATNAVGARWVIGLSPFLDRGVKDEVFRRIVGFVLEDMPLGSSLGIYDAYHLQTVCRIDVPRASAFRSGKTRANQFKDSIARLRQFLADKHPRPTAGGINFDQAVRLPQFMEFVGDNRAPAEPPPAVVILGGPLYLDDKEPGFSMANGYFPSDGHLLAGRDQSVFGVRERAGALSNLVVYFGYFGDPWISQVHQDRIARFWTLYLEGQGATLATFCGDLATVFDAVRSGRSGPAIPGPRSQPDPAQAKIEMLRLTRDPVATDWITRDVLANVAQQPPTTTIGPMKIGIRWQGNLDLDLYAAPRRDSETLFFQHTRSPEGYYYKDHRTSPLREYEFIEFESSVDVRQVDARINFYEGMAEDGPGGEVRIEFEGKIYTGRFSLGAHHGNQGRSGKGQAAFWTRINVPAILHLTELRREAGISSRGYAAGQPE